MLNHVSEIVVVVLLLPALMNLVLPLGTLAGWLAWRGFRHLLGKKGPEPEGSGLHAHSLAR